MIFLPKVTGKLSWKQTLAGLIVIFVVIYYILQLKQESLNPNTVHVNQAVHYGTLPNTTGLNWLIDTAGCRIPRNIPSESLSKKLFIKQDKFTCKKNVSDGLVYIDSESRLAVNASVKNLVEKHYKKSDKVALKCCAISITRYSVENNDFTNRKDKCIKLEKTLQMTTEIMKVECYIEKLFVYEDMFFLLKLKSDVEARCAAFEKIAEIDGLHKDDQLSVLIIGMDSLSRQNFPRQLSSSYKLLMEDLNAVEFLGYNRVGDNTFPNLIPLLSGYSDLELQNACWGGKKFAFDNCTFLWDLFGATGYRSSFVEDSLGIGLFTYQTKGFKRRPADYYGVTYFAASRDMKTKSSCLQSKSGDELVIKWAMDFQELFANKLHFGFHWLNQFSHDYLNNAQQIDPFLSAGLQRLIDKSLLNKTLLIIFSDHGMRHGPIYGTSLGEYESNLPFFSMVFPKWFEEKYRQMTSTLRLNAANRLVTVYDLRETLIHLLRFEATSMEQPTPVSTPLLNKGISLFNSIPATRTCANSGIPREYCSCYRYSVQLNVNSSFVLQLATTFIESMNQRLDQFKNVCSELLLSSITEARAELAVVDNSTGVDMSEIDKAFTDDKTHFFVKFNSEPGNGSFIGMLKYVSSNNSYIAVGDVKRTNKYGNSSYCIDQPKLKTSCYCTKLVKESKNKTLT